MSAGRSTTAYDPGELPIRDRYALLVGTVAPRPIALASTIDDQGNRNLAPFSYFNVFSIDPPVLMVGPTLRGRDGGVKDTLANARINGEIVVNLVDHAMVEGASLSSSDFPAEVDEFAGFFDGAGAGFQLGGSHANACDRVVVAARRTKVVVSHPTSPG